MMATRLECVRLLHKSKGLLPPRSSREQAPRKSVIPPLTPAGAGSAEAGIHFGQRIPKLEKGYTVRWPFVEQRDDLRGAAGRSRFDTRPWTAYESPSSPAPPASLAAAGGAAPSPDGRFTEIPALSRGAYTPAPAR